MALDVETGTFTKTTSTSTPVSQQVNLSNGSLTPKIIIIWGTGQTTQNRTYEDDARFSYGFSDGTNDACQAWRQDESAKNETYIFRNNAIISIIGLTTNTEVSVADISATAAGSFTLNWSTQSDTNALIYHYKVIGGSDITNCQVVSTTIGSTTTGNKSFNGSGTTYTPDWALMMNAADGSTVNTISAGADRGMIAIGAAKSTSERFVVSGRDETVTTSDCDMYINDAACMVHHDLASGAVTFLADFVSFDNAAGGGITINVSDGAGNANNGIAFLLVKGGKFECGVFQQRSGTGTQDVSFVDTRLKPSLVSLYGINSATKGSVVANMYLAFGASDGTNESCAWAGNQNAQATFVAARTTTNTKVFMQATPAGTASSSTTNAEADMNDMTTTGKFQLDWTTASATLHQIAYWAVGIEGNINFTRAPLVEAVYIQDRYINNTQKLYLRSTTDSTSGLPSTEQSTKTVNQSFQSASTNYVLSTAAGTSQTDWLKNIPNNSTMIYIARWVSPPLAGTGISSGTWTLNFAYAENSLNANGPVSGTNQVIWINCYVWRPSSSSKISTIIDSNSDAVFDEPSAANTEKVVHGTFTGSAVAVSDMQNNDVICLEIWFDLTATPNQQWDHHFYLNGTTENTTENATVSNHASFVEAPSPGFPLIGADSITVLKTPGGGTNFERSPSTENTTVSDSSLTRILSAARAPSADSTTISEDSLTRVQSSARAPSSDSITVSEDSLTRLLSASRAPSTDSPTVDEQLTRMLSAMRAPSSDSITAEDASLDRSQTWSRQPSDETVVVEDSSTTQMITRVRAPDSESITIDDSGLSRMLQAFRSPSSDSVTAEDSSTTQTITRVRAPGADDTTVSDASLTRLLSAIRSPTAEAPAIDEQLTRTLSASRSPESESTTVTDSSLTRLLTMSRTVPADNITAEDASTTQILTHVRVPAADDITVEDSSLTRMLQAFRSPSSDTVAVDENVSGGKLLERTPTADTITVSDASLNRMLSALRIPTAETVDIVEDSLTRILSAMRAPSADSVTTDEDIDIVHTTAGQFNRAPNAENVTISDASLTRILSAIRAPTEETVNLNEQLTRILSANRLTSLSDSTAVSEIDPTRIVSNIRTLSETPDVAEASLTRVLSALRSVSPPDTTVVSEVQSLVSHSRRLEETVTITEPVIQRIVTAIRATAPDTVAIDEQVFYQALHKFVFDSVDVAEQLFSIREGLSTAAAGRRRRALGGHR